MTKHTLFVCKSCHRSSEQRPENPPFDGDIFLDKIQTLYHSKFLNDEMEIRSIGCLWACDRGCVVSVASADKPTVQLSVHVEAYLFTRLPTNETASALLQFGHFTPEGRSR
ncbi:MAG: DUF1636 family protein [Cyanobacterium sp. T60_A2020_053]|nr:DUF1636 family protein [Cyanobacterium sp. T60_A2020_053]